MSWFYLFFANNDEFFGAVVIEAHCEPSAMRKTMELGLYPDGVGSVLVIEIPPDAPLPPDDHRNRMLSKAELDKLWGDEVISMEEHARKQMN